MTSDATTDGAAGGTATTSSEEGSTPTGDVEIDGDATLRVAINYPGPPTLDPHRVLSATANVVHIGQMYDRLTHIGPDMVVEPMVATAWEFSPDGSSVTFELRDDATFPDGTPVDAAAVKASLERAKTLEGSTAASALSAIETITADDPTTLTITANRPAADLPATLAGLEGAIINPLHLDSSLETTPAGSGPYVLGSYTPNESLSLTRRDGYWDPDAQKSATIEVVGIPTDSTRLNALRTGEVDLMMTTLGQYGEATELGDGYETYTYPAALPYTMYFNTGAPNIDTTAVRQALNWAIDREAISDGLLNGQCAPTDQLLTEAFDGHVDDPEFPYSYDPETAKELLAEAGVADGFSMRVLVPAGLTLYEDIATAIQAQLSDIGVAVELVAQQSTELFPSWAGGEYEGFVNVRGTRPNSAGTFEVAYLNPARYPGPVPDGFTEALDITRDPSLPAAELTSALEEVSEITNAEAMDLYVCAGRAVWTANDKVVGAGDMGWSFFSANGDLRYVGLAAG